MLFLQFYIDQDRYVLDTQHIISVVPLMKIRKADEISAKVPQYMRGYIYYKNQTVPVVDVTELVSGKKSNPYLSTRIALISYPSGKIGDEIVGFIIEKATEVVNIKEEDFSRDSVENAVKVESVSYTGPVARTSEGLVRQLNIQKLIELKFFDQFCKQAINTH
jgi:chemotaxis-related protein WspB